MRTFLFALLLSGSLIAQNSADSYPITHVKVYKQGAQIQRDASLNLKAGSNTINFKGLSGNLDPKSIQIKGLASLSLISVSHQRLNDDSIQQDSSLNALKEAIEENKKRQQSLIDEKEGLILELKYLESNSNIGGTEGYNLIQLKEISQYVRQERSVNARAISKLDQSRASLQKELQQLQKELLQKIEALGLNNITISAVLMSPKAQRVNLSLIYQNNQAGWTSNYALKVTSLNKPVQLSHKALIYQNTGEDWTKVNLELNTGSMLANGQIPTLYPDFLYPIQAQNIRGSRADAPQMRYKSSTVESLDMAKEVVFSANSANSISTNLMSRSFIIAEKVSIANGKQETNLLRDLEIPALYEYQSIPKLDPAAYLIAKIYDWTEYQLENGEISLYNQGNYVGKSYLNANSGSDSLELSLGKDADIVVQRERLKEESGNSFLGSKKTATYAYELKVFNKKASAIELVLIDQIPVAQHEDIKVEMEMGKLKISQLAQGEIRWKLNIPAKTEVTKKLRYEVSYPKDMVLNH